MRQDDQFMGLFYKIPYNMEDYEQLDERTTGDYKVVPGKDEVIFAINSSELIDFNDLSLIQVSIDNDFLKRNDTRIGVIITDRDGSGNLYWVRKYLIHFAEQELNSPQTGTCNFPLDPFEETSEKQISLSCFPGTESTELKNIRIRFLGKK